MDAAPVVVRPSCELRVGQHLFFRRRALREVDLGVDDLEAAEGVFVGAGVQGRRPTRKVSGTAYFRHSALSVPKLSLQPSTVVVQCWRARRYLMIGVGLSTHSSPAATFPFT